MIKGWGIGRRMETGVMGEGGIEGIPISIFMFVFLVGTRGGLEGDTRGRFSYIGDDMEEEFKGEEGIEVGKVHIIL